MNKRHVFVRPIYPEESSLFLGWALENPHGDFDPETPKFRSSRTWCAYDKDGPLVFQTIQQPLMLESLAPRPGATKEQIAVAMKELTQNAITQAHIGGAGEIYFMGSDEGTNALAMNQIFEEVPGKMYRLKIKELSCV
jgi:hypothetical protein